MATIYNADLKRELISAAGIQLGRDSVPSQIADKVVPVMEVNPKLLRTCFFMSGTATNATSSNIIPANSSKDIYICGCTLSIIKDASSTSTFSAITATDYLENAGALMSISSLTLTAQTDTNSVVFNPPIKLKRGTGVNITNTTNVANITAKGTAWGYFVEDGNI